MRNKLRTVRISGLALLFISPGFGQSTGKTQSYPLTGTQDLVLRNVQAEPGEYKGRKAIRITKPAEGNGLAFIKGTDFQDGTIEVDIAVRLFGVPPGVRMPGFTGIAFRVRPDASRYELIYLRPGNSQSENQVMRNHSVQYTAEPDFGWYELRRAWPWAYEAWADLQLETWTHVKLEISGRSTRLYLNGSDKPALIVDGMKGEDLKGAIALWSFANEESWFSNLRITPAEPKPIRNGGEVTGTWEIQSSTDAAGPVNGSLKLARQGTKITGTWSGLFGTDQPVTGTWRDGYVDLTLSGTWPKERPGIPGSITLTFEGWVDGDAANGRMKIEGRADGQWSGRRTQPKP